MSIFDRIQVRIEGVRGCGYRVEGGEYLVSGGKALHCGRLPLHLFCGCCRESYPFFRGIKMIYPDRFTAQPCQAAKCLKCPPFQLPENEKIALMWVGTQHYWTPQQYREEAARMGVSKRFNGKLPENFVVGKTYVFLAHSKAIHKGTRPKPDTKAMAVTNQVTALLNNKFEEVEMVLPGKTLGRLVMRKGKPLMCEPDGTPHYFINQETDETENRKKPTIVVPAQSVDIVQPKEDIYEPGIFYAFVPTAIEYVITGKETKEELEERERQGFTLVRVVRSDQAQNTLDFDAQKPPKRSRKNKLL